MSKEYMKVENILSAPKEVFIRLKKGLCIFLLVVAPEAMAESTYDCTPYPDIPSTHVGLAQSNIDIQLERNGIALQGSKDLFDSLMIHRGAMMTTFEKEGFWMVANQVANINFTDSMVCYDEEDHMLSYDLLTSDGLAIHLSQYFEEPSDQIVYSIERDGIFIFAGHAPIENFIPQLSKNIQEADTVS